MNKQEGLHTAGNVPFPNLTIKERISWKRDRMANKSSMSHFRIWISSVSKLRGRFSRPPRTPTRSRGSFITRWARVGESDGFMLRVIDRPGNEAIGNGPLYFTTHLRGKCTDPICWSERLWRSISSSTAGSRGQCCANPTRESMRSRVRRGMLTEREESLGRSHFLIPYVKEWLAFHVMESDVRFSAVIRWRGWYGL